MQWALVAQRPWAPSEGFHLPGCALGTFTWAHGCALPGCALGTLTTLPSGLALWRRRGWGEMTEHLTVSAPACVQGRQEAPASVGLTGAPGRKDFTHRRSHLSGSRADSPEPAKGDSTGLGLRAGTRAQPACVGVGRVGEGQTGCLALLSLEIQAKGPGEPWRVKEQGQDLAKGRGGRETREAVAAGVGSLRPSPRQAGRPRAQRGPPCLLARVQGV